MAAAGPRFDLPAPDPETQPFWDAARAGTLLIRSQCWNASSRCPLNQKAMPRPSASGSRKMPA